MIEQPNKAIDYSVPNAQMTLVSKTPCEEVLARYTTITPLVALQLYARTGQPSGVITSLPQNVTMVICGTSRFAARMIEVCGKVIAMPSLRRISRLVPFRNPTGQQPTEVGILQGM
jgi:hypothetical protein